MGAWARVAAGACAALALAGCGGRTALERAPLDASAGPGLDGEAGAADGDTTGEGGGGYTLCAPLLGPIPPEEAAEGSFYAQCNADFPRCVQVGAQWACCHGLGPYDGPHGSCYF